jgi:hypothetical protein
MPVTTADLPLPEGPVMRRLSRIGSTDVVLSRAEKDPVTQPSRDSLEVVVEQLLDELNKPLSVVAVGDDLAALAESRYGIGDRNREFAALEEGVIVLAVANTHRVVRRKLELGECRVESGCLVHARRQDHDGSLVEDDLELEPQLADGFEHPHFLGFSRRNNDLANRKRNDVSGSQQIEEPQAGRSAQRAYITGVGPMQDAAILGDDAVEDWERREHASEVVELAAGDEQKTEP